MRAGPVGEMVERIVAGFEPLRVILFGSLARGGGTDDSDVGLLVVFSRVEREDKRRLTVEIRRALEGVPFPKDIVVADLEEIERHGEIAGTVLHRALSEGQVVYGRPVLPRAEGSGGMAEEEADELAVRLVRHARAEALPREDVVGRLKGEGVVEGGGG